MNEHPVAASDLAEALVSLLSHDMRAPLGPLALASSSIADDPAVCDHARELARFAESQGARLARLIDATVRAIRRPPAIARVHARLRELADEAAGIARALGGGCEVSGDDDGTLVERQAVRDALAGLVECCAGDGGDAVLRVTETPSAVEVEVSGAEVARCREALGAGAPSDRRTALALGAVAVFEAHGGAVEASDRSVVVRLPRGSA